MLSQKIGQFVAVTEKEFKANDGRQLVSYRIGVIDDDEIVDNQRVKFFKITEQALSTAGLNTKEGQQKANGKQAVMTGRDLPRYIDSRKIWITEFKVTEVTLK